MVSGYVLCCDRHQVIWLLNICLFFLIVLIAHNLEVVRFVTKAVPPNLLIGPCISY